MSIAQELFAYLTIVSMLVYTYWGYTKFDELDDFEQKWKMPWLAVMAITIVGLIIFYGTL